MAVAVASLLAGIATPASAQLYGPILGSEFQPSSDRGRNTSVLERERPEYEAIGIRAGSFNIYPRVDIGTGYSSNVYGLTTDPKDDVFFVLDPSISAESDWGTHAVSAEAGARLRRFASESSKNETGYFARTDGRIDISRDLSYATGTSFEKLFEPRSSGSFPVDALASVPYYRTFAYGRLTRQGGRVRSILGVDFTHVDFDNVEAIGGGTLNQKDRDRSVARVTGRADYAVTPDVSLFGQLSYAKTDYERPLVIGLANRDGDEVRAIAGASFDLTALVRGQIGLGYVKRSYHSPIYPDLGGLAAEARFEYFVTELTTMTAAVRRYIEDANIVGSGGYYVTNMSVGIDHELLRNLLLNARAEYEFDDYRGVVGNGKGLSLSTGARYFANRSVGVAFDLGYLERKSNDPLIGQSFDEFHGTVSLILQR